MQDHFMEEVATKQKNGLNRAIYMLSWVVIVLSGFVAMMLFSFVSRSLTAGSFDWMSLILLVVSAGICAYTYFFHDRILTEYEYTFTNGALDFAEVYNNKKRKSLGSLNVRTVDAFGKVSSGSFHRYLSMKDVKRMNWFLNRDSELYYFFFSKDNKKKMIVFEPSEEMVNLILQYLPRGVYQEN